MAARIVQFVLILSLWLPAADPGDSPYNLYLPLIANGTPYTQTYLPAMAYGSQPDPCQIISQTPRDGSYLPPNTDFNNNWSLKNISQETWPANTAMIVFLSGDRMHLNEDAHGLPYDVAPGGTLNLTIKMRSPATAGGYTSHWAIKVDSATLCPFFIIISVQ